MHSIPPAFYDPMLVLQSRYLDSRGRSLNPVAGAGGYRIRYSDVSVEQSPSSVFNGIFPITLCMRFRIV